jgi:hypothetical protein
MVTKRFLRWHQCFLFMQLAHITQTWSNQRVISFDKRFPVGIKFQSHRTATQDGCELFLEIDFSLKKSQQKISVQTRSSSKNGSAAFWHKFYRNI